MILANKIFNPKIILLTLFVGVFFSLFTSFAFAVPTEEGGELPEVSDPAPTEDEGTQDPAEAEGEVETQEPEVQPTPAQEDATPTEEVETPEVPETSVEEEEEEKVQEPAAQEEESDEEAEDKTQDPETAEEETPETPTVPETPEPAEEETPTVPETTEPIVEKDVDEEVEEPVAQEEEEETQEPAEEDAKVLEIPEPIVEVIVEEVKEEAPRIAFATAAAPDFDYTDAGIIAVNHFLEINDDSAGIPLEGGEQFGTSVANLGDLDGSGDGVTTIAVGGDYYGTIASFVNITNLGAIYIMNLNADGTVIGTARRISEDTNGINIAGNDFFGSSIENLGDLDIGLDDAQKAASLVTIAVGAVGEKSGGTFGKGAVHLINLNSTGGIVGGVVKIDDTDSKLTLSNFGEFGASIANLGDLDGSGDGVTTIAVGSPVDGTGGSVYLINIDSAGEIEGTPVKIVNGSTGITLGSGDEFGASIANLGDLDGTGAGVTTIAVGVPLDDTGGTSNTGAVYLINLSYTPSIVGTPVKIVNGSTGITLAENNYFGQSLANIGDLDGAGTGGVTTLAVGAFGGEEIYTINLDSAGAIVGTPGVINNAALSATIEDGNQFGSSIVNLGDINGDGIDELVVGENAEDTGQDSSGEIHIISFAKNQYTFTTADTVDITLPEIETGEPAPTYTITTLPTGLSFTAATRKITGTPAAVTAAADYTLTATIGSDTDTFVFNIEVVAPTAPDFGYAQAGVIAVNHFLEINSASTGITLSSDDLFGFSIANLGDLDGDGTGGETTIAVGAPTDDAGGTNRGAVHIINLDSAGAIIGTSDVEIVHDTGVIDLANEDFFGASIADLGDLDGTGAGVKAIAVGAIGDDTGGDRSGAVYIINLNADGTMLATLAKIAHGSTGIDLVNSDEFGTSIADLGDLDGSGDGVTTIAVGAPGDDTGGADTGTVYLINLNASGGIESVDELNDSTSGISLSNTDQFGQSIANLGDIDGAGTGGVITIAVGAMGDDTGGTNRGAVHIINLESAGAIIGTSDVEIVHDTGVIDLVNEDSFGRSVANLGDLDGNGVGATTIAVGATGGEKVYTINLNTSGAMVGTAGVINSAALSATLNDGDSFGTSIANLGDLNGDGNDEIIVGEADNGAGVAHIISFAKKQQYTLTTADTVEITLPAIETGFPAPTYTVTTLPIGLDFDDATRTITGTPTAVTAATDYTLTATIGSDTDTYVFNIEVVQAVAPDFGYADAGIIAVNHFAKISDSNAELTLPGGQFFGSTVANLGDLDGTGAGVTTIAVGTPNDSTGGQGRGAIYLVNINAAGGIEGTPVKIDSSTTGITLENQDGFGISIVDLGDLDIGLTGTDITSSLTTIAVGTSKDDDGGDTVNSDNGAVHIINLNSSGIVGGVVKISDNTAGIDLSNGTEFGKSIANLGDLNIGLTPAQATSSMVTLAFGIFDASTVGGEVHIINLDSAGAVVGDHHKISATLLGIILGNQDFFGNSIANLGDLDIGLSSSTDKTNSLVTIAIGAPAAALAFGTGPENATPYPNNGGSIYLINFDASGTKVGDVIKIGKDTPGLNVNHGEGFGGSIESLGDIDGTGDGIATLAIGNNGIDTIKIINLDSTGAIVGPVGIIGDGNISDTLSRFDNFGRSIKNIGDINGDGIDEIAVGETAADSTKGVVHIISIASKEYGLTTSDAVNIFLPAAETALPTPTYSFAPSLPTELTFDRIARTITGTPTQDTRGKDYTLTATNPQGTDTFSFRLGVGGLVPTLSSDNDLSGLTISSYTSGGRVGPIWNVPVVTPLTLQPTFSSSVTEYTISETLAVGTQAAIIFPTTSSPRATVTVDGEDATSGIGSAQIILNGGDNVIPIVVTAEDGTAEEYTITVVKTRPPLEISTISTDGYVNDAEDESNITISGFTSGIADAEPIEVTFSDANITAKTATVTNNAWQTTIPSAEMKAAAEGNITVTATHESSSETATKNFAYDRTPPTVVNPIPDRTATVGTDFFQAITDRTILDGTAGVEYASTGQSNGIVFAGFRYIGAGELLRVGTVRITLIGIDAAGNTVTDTFDVVITDPRYDSTAPTITKAEATRKTSITLTSPEELTGTATTSDFSVSYGSVTNATPERVTINDDAIIIVVDDPMTTEDTITVSYSGITITDIIGNSLKAFSNQAVENNIRSGGGSGGVHSSRTNRSSNVANLFFGDVPVLTEKERLIADIRRKIEIVQNKIEEIRVKRESSNTSPYSSFEEGKSIKQQILEQIEEVQKRIDEILANSA